MVLSQFIFNFFDFRKNYFVLLLIVSKAILFIISFLFKAHQFLSANFQLSFSILYRRRISYYVRDIVRNDQKRKLLLVVADGQINLDIHENFFAASRNTDFVQNYSLWIEIDFLEFLTKK